MSTYNFKTLNQGLLLTSSGFVIMLVGMIYSLQAPFYPAVAESKNASATAYGFVFSSAEVAQIIGMPLIGTYLTKFGTMNGFVSCSIISSVCMTLFGFVNYIYDSTWFISISILLRIIDSFTHGVVFISVVVLVNAVFSEATARNLSLSQAMFGIGLSIGPAVGALLYNIGGFTLPFITFSSIQLVVAGITRWTLGIATSDNDNILINVDKKKKNNPEFGYKRVLKIPHVLVYNFCIIISANSNTFVQTLLEPYLRQFNLSTSIVGLIFLYNGAMFAIGPICFAFICEKLNRPHLITCFALLSVTIATLLVGPDLLFQFEQKLWLLMLSLTLLSLGTAAVFTSGNYLSVKELLKRGFPDNDLTSALMTGLMLESVGIGCFTGPILAGIFYDNFGFRKATRFLTILNLLTTLILIVVSNCFPQSHHEINSVITKNDYDEENERVALLSWRAGDNK